MSPSTARPRHHLQPNVSQPTCSKCPRSTNAHHRFQNNDNSCLKKRSCVFAISLNRRTNLHTKCPHIARPFLEQSETHSPLPNQPLIAQRCQIDKNPLCDNTKLFHGSTRKVKKKILTAWRVEPQDRTCLLACKLSTISLVTFTLGPNSWLILAMLWSLRISCCGVSGP